MAKKKEPSGRGAPDAQEDRAPNESGTDDSIASKHGGLIFALVILGLIVLAIVGDLLR